MLLFFVFISQLGKLFVTFKLFFIPLDTSIIPSHNYKLDLDGEERLVGIPLLLDEYCPWLAGLPLYILRSDVMKVLFVSIILSYNMSKKYLPILYSDLLHEMGNYFLDIQYNGRLTWKL